MSNITKKAKTMFKKLLQSLPFNPSLIGQVSFYSKRLHAEASVRRLGFVLVTMAMFVQMFAVIAPPENSLAASDNDIIWGGAHSVDALRQAYESNAMGDTQAIFNYFGITVDQINAASYTSIDTRGVNVDRYYSIGRTIGSRTDSFQLSVPRSQTNIYMRSLGGWAQTTWPAFKLSSTRFGTVWILKDCGNIVTEGIPPLGDSKLELTKTANPGHNSTVMPGDKIHYSLIFSNKGNAPANNLKIEDTVPNQVNNIEVGEAGAFEYVNGRNFTAIMDAYGKPSILGSDPNLQYQVNFWVTVTADASPGRFCNRARISSDDSAADSNEICHEIPACPYNPALLPNNPSCKAPESPIASCTILNARFLSRTQVEFEALATASGGASVSSFQFNPGTGDTQNVLVNASGDVSKKFTYDYPASPAPATYQATVTAVTSAGNKTSSACARAVTIEKEKTPLVTIEKTAVNGTTGSGTTTITAEPGQNFSFVFTIQNVGDADAINYALPEDNFNDVLEYADITAVGDAQITKNETNQSTVIRWLPVTIGAGQTLTKSITLKMKDSLPKTNTPPSNPQSYDCRIQNSIMTSTVIVNIDKSHCITKVVEQTTTSLPNTGPGASLVIGFSLTTIVGYFFARSRLLARELELVKADYSGEGTMA